MSVKKSELETQTKMLALRVRFIANIKPRVDFLATAVVKLQASDTTDLPDIISVAHQLAGSCGTFQFQRLGLLARQVEMAALAVEHAAEANQTSIEILADAIELFLHDFGSGSAEEIVGFKAPVNRAQASEELWLVCLPADISDELHVQLQAFGYSIILFSSYSDCVRAFNKQTPALLFCAVESGDSSLFMQQELLSLLERKSVALLIFSKSDSFELRIEAVRHKAIGCYSSCLDIPAILLRINKLFDVQTLADKRVSILDDDVLLSEHYAEVLKLSGIDVQIIRNPIMVIEELLRFKPDLLLLDMHMPDFSGAEISGVIRQYDVLSSLQITFLSAEQDFNQQLQALSFGADDFITKPISNENLVRAVCLRLARTRDIKALIERDNLTGLVKHSAIKEVVAVEFDRMNRHGEHFCVAMVDLDHFKSVNDTHGHAMGDVVIRTIATLLRKRLRRSDRAGRYGGEEFLVVLPNCSAEQAKALLESLLQAFKAIYFSAIPDPFSCTFSAGVACSSSGFADAAALIVASDQALYQAKHNGRSQVAVFE